MIPQKCLYFFKRFLEMGPRTATKLLIHRLQKQRFVTREHARWYNGASYHSWENLKAQHQLGSFEEFFSHLARNNLCMTMLNDTEFRNSLPSELKDHQAIMEYANKAVQKEISILGYGTFTFNDTISWHTDCTTSQPSPQSWKEAFYSDISIGFSEDSSHHRFPDIKVPWELSRLQHFFYLGLGYQQMQKRSNHEQMSWYANAFVTQATDWIINNKFLQGVNWLNPMEVAIRSINLIWAFHFFKNEQTIHRDFWKQYVCVLYDHKLYLEHTWELSDKPNNHYIADLIGHLYLCTFFIDIKPNYRTQLKTIKNLLAQWKQQVLPDGTSYEGSTNYHRLVTEMMMHFVLLAKKTPFILPRWVEETYTTMKQFLFDCSDQSNNLVQIGDNDSGRILAGFYWEDGFKHKRNTFSAEHMFYPHFGISIIKRKGWHVTLRHATYQSFQPSGHFHHDQLSITVSINGIPIIVDPGTFVYTANPQQRNYFRNMEIHNGFFVHYPQEKYRDLFQLDRVEQVVSDSGFFAQSNHCTQQGLQACRLLTLHNEKSELMMRDWWKQSSRTKTTQPSQTQWRFHLAPGIYAEQKDCTTWIISANSHKILELSTELYLAKEATLYSPAYGSIHQSYSLIAFLPTQVERPITTRFKKIC